jgi:hypothetical protein
MIPALNLFFRGVALLHKQFFPIFFLGVQVGTGINVAQRTSDCEGLFFKFILHLSNIEVFTGTLYARISKDVWWQEVHLVS